MVRPARAVVRGLDRSGREHTIEGRELLARAFQHEMDHLDGTLFFDRMRTMESLTFLDEYARYWAKD